MKPDGELVREFVESRAESAFTELVNRHISLVYSAACRETRGDFAAAEDVTQLVFIELVRKAAALQRHPTLAGWLYTSVRYVSANLRRTNQRRNIREKEACIMNELLRPAPDDPTWQEIRPVLDDAMHELHEHDRDAVLLRFFEGKNMREVGEALSLTENAARMRVERALEKLRKALARRGVHSTSSALAGALAFGMVAAPPALMGTVTSSALAAAAASGASASTLFGLTLTKLNLVGLGAAVAAAVSVPIWQQQRYERLKQENVALRNDLEQLEQLRQENERLADALRAGDQLTESERQELLRWRAGSAAARSGAAGQGGVPAGKVRQTWRQRFEKFYRLHGGEMLRCVSAPLIPERAEFCRREFRNRRSAPDCLVLRQLERGLQARGEGFDLKNSTLEGVLRRVLGLKRYEFYGAENLLTSVVVGDWVVRAGSSVEAQLADLERIWREATGRTIRFAKQAGGRDVIVVQGHFAPVKEGQRFYIYAENRTLDWDAGGGGEFQRFMEALGDRLNIPFVSEVQLQNEWPIAWSLHSDTDYSRAGDRREELLRKTLETLKQQTQLSYTPQHRAGEIWIVSEQR